MLYLSINNIAKASKANNNINIKFKSRINQSIRVSENNTNIEFNI